jgi:hypothetical protein
MKEEENINRIKIRQKTIIARVKKEKNRGTEKRNKTIKKIDKIKKKKRKKIVRLKIL